MDPNYSWSQRMNALGDQDYAMLEKTDGLIQCRTLDLDLGIAREYFYSAGETTTGLTLLDAILGDDSVYGLHSSGLGETLSPDESPDGTTQSLRSITIQKWHPIECPVAVLSGGHGPYFYVARTSVIDGASIVQDVGKAGTIENAVMLLVQQLHSAWRVPSTMALTIVDPRGNLTPFPGSTIG